MLNGKEKAMERRKRDRRDFSYYMRVMNENTGELVGHLADISIGGFKLESLKPISKNTEYPLRIELSSDISEKPFIVFIANSKWCQPHLIDTTLYNVGFQIVNMSPDDQASFKKIYDVYGSQKSEKKTTDANYLWR
jgi:hypothetical protein